MIIYKLKYKIKYIYKLNNIFINIITNYPNFSSSSILFLKCNIQYYYS